MIASPTAVSNSGLRFRRVIERPALWLVSLLLLLLMGCGGPQHQETPQSQPAPPVPDRTVLLQAVTLGAADVVEVRVYEEKELTGLFRLSSDGTFQYPLVGQVQAAGLTPGQLSDQLTEKLKQGFLRNPQVTVFVKELNSKKVFVLGEVARPGTFLYEDNMTIVQAISMAGGFKDLADKNHTILTRVVEGVEKKFTVPVEGIGMGREQNVHLQPGDIVFVPETWL